MRSVLEVCVDSTASALAAKRGGADRLELCADLIVGGTTPSLTLVQQVKAETGLPVRALLRPRFGDFCYDSYELAQMEQLAAELVEAGADGIVTGARTPLPRWKQPGSWAFAPSSPADRRPVRRRALHCCGSWQSGQGRMWKFWQVPGSRHRTSRHWPRRPVSGHSIFPANRCCKAA